MSLFVELRRRNVLRMAGLYLVAAWLTVSGGATSAEPIKVATLQRLLQEAPSHELHFTETRESPWLKAPVLSSGTM